MVSGAVNSLASDYRGMNRLKGKMVNLVWDVLRVRVSIGQQSEMELIKYMILGINVEVCPDVDNWEQDQA